MATRHAIPRRGLGRTAAALLALTITACVGGGEPAGPRYSEVTGQIPKLSPNQARIFFYRDYELYEGTGRPYIRLNGMPAVISEPGGVSYRDVGPGTYLISVDSIGRYPNQDKTATLKPGEVLYVKIESDRAYNEGFVNPGPDTFVVVIIDPTQGQREIETRRYFAQP